MVSLMTTQGLGLVPDGPRSGWASGEGPADLPNAAPGARPRVAPGDGPAEPSDERPTGGLLGDVGTSLQPPPQTTWGTTSFTANFVPWVAPPPELTNPRTNVTGPDDKAVQQQSQTVTGGSILHQFYVYWVDGGAGDPYYVVILKQSGQLGPGAALANVADTRGYFQYQLDLSTTLLDADDEVFATGVTCLATSPSTFASSPTTGPSTVVGLGVDMTLDQAGVPVAFTAGCSDGLLLSDWGVQNLYSTAGPAWTFHQVTGWDPTMDVPSAMEQWWKSVYPSNDKVIALPSASFADLGVETIAAWQIQGPDVIGPGRSCVVHFHGTIAQTVGLFHDIDDCLGAYGSKHHHLFSSEMDGVWAWEFDLASLLPATGSSPT